MRAWPHPLNYIHACVRLLFEGGYYSGCGFYSNKYGIISFICRIRSCLVSDFKRNDALISEVPYSQKFGGLAVYITTAKLKIHQNFLLTYIRMAIPYRTAKYKSANILEIVILGSTTKSNSRQYFRLYGSFLPLLYLGVFY